MNLKAIYRPIPSEHADQQETLVYSLPSGFAWVKNQDPQNHWHCYQPTAVGAEQEARKAGFDPVAIVHLKD
jgi:hypothetical protein